MNDDLARRARHLSARLEELEGDCVLLRAWAAAADGRVEARFPGRNAAALARRVSAACPVRCRAVGPDVLSFALGTDVPFEALDAVWGALFESISP